MNTLGLIELNRCRFHSCLSVTHTPTHIGILQVLYPFDADASHWNLGIQSKAQSYADPAFVCVGVFLIKASVSMLLWISDAQSSSVALGIRRREKGTEQVHGRCFKGCGIEHQGPVCCRWVELVETDIWSPHRFISLRFSQRRLLGLCLEHTTHAQARAPVVNLMSDLANKP